MSRVQMCKCCMATVEAREVFRFEASNRNEHHVATVCRDCLPKADEDTVLGVRCDKCKTIYWHGKNERAVGHDDLSWWLEQGHFWGGSGRHMCKVCIEGPNDDA